MRIALNYDGATPPCKSLRIKGRVYKKVVSITCDTGASVTVMSRKAFSKMGISLKDCEKVELMCADGKVMGASYVEGVEISLGSQTYDWNVYVADIEDEMLLGLDFLHKYRAKLDLNSMSMELSPADERAVVKVARVTNVVPNNLTMVKCKLDPPLESRSDIIFEPFADIEGLQGTVTASCLDRGGKELYVMMFNDGGNGLVRLKKDTVLGWTAPVDHVYTEEERRASSDGPLGIVGRVRIGGNQKQCTDGIMMEEGEEIVESDDEDDDYDDDRVHTDDVVEMVDLGAEEHVDVKCSTSRHGVILQEGELMAECDEEMGELILSDSEVESEEERDIDVDGERVDDDADGGIVNEDVGVKGVPAHLVELFERSKQNLSEEQIGRLAAALTKYADAFSKHDDDLGVFTAIKHTIPTGDTPPFKHPLKRVPLAMQQEEKKTIES